MAHDSLKFYGSRKLLGVWTIWGILFVGLVSLAQAQQAIPETIQLSDEIPAYSRLSTPVSAPVYADPSVIPAQYGPVQAAAQAPSANPAPAMISESVPTQNYAPAPNFAPRASAGVPTYTPDGTVPQTEMAPVMDEFAGMPEPCPGLFLPEFCESWCSPCGSGLLGPGRFFVEGYVDQGFNVNSNSSSYGEPMGVDDKEGYQLNQLYLSFGRYVCKGSQWSLGGQIDVMYGTDYYYMTSTGLETTQSNDPHWNGTRKGTDEFRASRNLYGMALPQAYLEVYAPILAGVDVKVGHFHSVMGFESNQANQNFFYSRSYTSIYGMPTSMTGVMTDWRLGDCWSVVAGAVNEWNCFDSPNDHYSFVVGATYENRCGNFAFSALVMNGKQNAATFQANDYSDDSANTTVLDLFAKFKFTERLAYVVEFNYGNNDAEVYDILNDDTFKGRNWYGFSNYLFYCMSDTLTLGARFEWFHDKENTVVSGGYQSTFANMGVNYFSWTFGANWDPRPWLTIRPEIRWDFSDMELEANDQTWYSYDRNTANYQFTVGCDAIVRF